MELSRRIPFHALLPAHHLIAAEIQAAVDRVLNSGSYILGPELESFESQFATYIGVKHAVGVANGTDAIELALRAADIGPGDEVITVSHTAVPTVCAVERAGAKPVLVDVDPDSYTIDPRQVEAAILSVKLTHLDENNATRRRLAAEYRTSTRGVTLPAIDPGDNHVYHLFVIRCRHRDAMREWLDGRGVGTAVHYPTPVHLQPA